MDTLRSVLSVCLLSSVCLGIGGCIVATDTSKEVVPTLGQELQDLHVARDKGSISDDEYAQAKQRLLREHN
jgi:hypothetical protein